MGINEKKRLLFLPDQHLGRNTAYQLGIGLDEMALWDPLQPALLNQSNKEKCKVILWNGYCSVHQQFSLENVDHIRKQHPNMQIIVHPECSFDIVQAADKYGSTDYIIRTIRASKPGSEWTVGTDNNLVYRLMNTIKDKKIVPLNTHSCPCLTMNRIDLPHLAWVMDNLQNNKVVNPITVDKTTQTMALKALNKMLELS